MSSMVVTPTVLKSSGWLNSDASCRVAREVVRSGVRCGPGGKRAVGAVVAQAARREAARLEVRAEGTHQKHVFHGCDAGRVGEVQRLVELRRALPSRRGGHIYEAGAVGAVVELAARREAARLEVRGEGTHLKHALHGCDFGRVEVQRLVELLRVLPSRKGGHTKAG
eukprot:scaffold40881_cov43-Phaeocystis_antarctica.AAC.1